MTKNKFLFLILAGALVFATLGCKQVTNSGSSEQGGGDKPSVEPTPEPTPVPDTWTEITDITKYAGKFSGSTEMTGWQFVEPWAESFKLTQKDVEGVVVPLDMTVEYPVEEKVYYSMTVSLKAFFEHTAGLSGSTLDKAWADFKTGDEGYFTTYDNANYKATVTQTLNTSVFNEWISGDSPIMRISVNQDQSKVKYEGLTKEAGWIVTVILNKQ